MPRMILISQTKTWKSNNDFDFLNGLNKIKNMILISMRLTTHDFDFLKIRNHMNPGEDWLGKTTFAAYTFTSVFQWALRISSNILCWNFKQKLQSMYCSLQEKLQTDARVFHPSWYRWAGWFDSVSLFGGWLCHRGLANLKIKTFTFVGESSIIHFSTWPK